MPAFAAAAMVTALAVTMAACGFHLRGRGGDAALPASLATVRVVTSGPAETHALADAVRQALVRAGATVTEAAGTPTLVLLGETIESRVASVSPGTAKANAYVLHYTAGFRLDGPRPPAPQTVRLQRDYSFDPAQALAREQQERELVADMRQEAAQQIVRRLARALPPGAK